LELHNLKKRHLARTKVWDLKKTPKKARGEAKNSLDAAQGLRQPFGLQPHQSCGQRERAASFSCICPEQKSNIIGFAFTSDT
jgi:hypothetical protein